MTQPGDFHEGEPISGPAGRTPATSPPDGDEVSETGKTRGDPEDAVLGEGTHIGSDGDFGGEQSAGWSSETGGHDPAEDPADSRQVTDDGGHDDRG